MQKNNQSNTYTVYTHPTTTTTTNTNINKELAPHIEAHHQDHTTPYVAYQYNQVSPFI